MSSREKEGFPNESALLWLAGFGVNANPMRPHGGAHNPSCCLCDDGVGWLLRHVAVNAVVRNFRSQCFRLGTAFYPMTAQASARISGSRLFGCVNIVTGRAAHVWRRQKTAALFEQSNLITVHFWLRRRVHRKRLQIAIQRLARKIGKRRLQLYPLRPTMAQRAQVHLPVPGKPGWVQDCFFPG